MQTDRQHIVHRCIRLISVFGLLCSVVACGPFSAAATAPVVGNAAPALDLPALRGDAVQLTDLQGQVVVVNFWATWCEPCEQETPRLVDWQRQYTDQGLAVLGVNTLYQDSQAAVTEFADQYAINYPVLLDSAGTTSNQWQARPLPRSYVIDRAGVVRFVKVGELTQRDFDAQITPLLNQ